MASYTIWFIIALCLAGGEMLTGTLYLLAVAIGVAVGGIADLLGANTPINLVITAMTAIAIFITLNYVKKRHYLNNDLLPAFDIGQPVHIIRWQDAHHARIRYRGTQWDAELVGTAHHTPNAQYEIIGQKGNVFLIQTRDD